MVLDEPRSKRQDNYLLGPQTFIGQRITGLQIYFQGVMNDKVKTRFFKAIWVVQVGDPYSNGLLVWYSIGQGGIGSPLPSQLVTIR